MYTITWGSQVTLEVKNSPASAGDIRNSGFNPWIGKIPWRRAWQLTAGFLPGESPWTEEPGGLQWMGPQRVRHDWATKHSTDKDFKPTIFRKFKELHTLLTEWKSKWQIRRNISYLTSSKINILNAKYIKNYNISSYGNKQTNFKMGKDLTFFTKDDIMDGN